MHCDVMEGNHKLSVLSIVGKSNSGKTTLVEKLIPELKRRGYKIGTVKHAHHGFTLDRQGKDSGRHRAAGADMVIVAGPDAMAMVKNHSDGSLAAMIPYMTDMDLVIVEGFKHGKQPKIEICRADNGKSPIDPPVTELVAWVSDLSLERGVPKFGLDDIAPLADWIEKEFLIP